MSASELSILENQYTKVTGYSTHYAKMSLLQLTIEAHKESELLKSTKLETEPDLKLLAILREGIKHQFGIYPYNTQMMVILSLLQNKEGYKSRLAEVLTGEGKSTIITILASYLVLSGEEQVYIITSSQDLAIRDQKKYDKFFEKVNISSSHTSYQDPDPKHFDAQIIYGTNYNFEFAILRSKIYDKKFFREENRVVIVDEVDNLFINTALNSARISYPTGSDVSWIYEPILRYITKNNLLSLEFFKEYLKGYNPKEYHSMKEYLTNEYLTTLISSAQIALTKKINYDYVIRFDPEEGKQKVIIVDVHNTGRLNHVSRWSADIHEFVKALNGIKPEPESLTVASISHPSFFALYSRIYGLTGTIGKKEERSEIKSIYNVDFFDAPSHFVSQKKPVVIELLNSIEDHYMVLLTKLKMRMEEGRPVLILFQSIDETKVFARVLTNNKLNHHILNEVQETNEEYILNNARKPGAITIATNTVGRGTDIILSEDSIKHGGLHVILSFLPANLRVEEHACGRAQLAKGKQVLVK